MSSEYETVRKDGKTRPAHDVIMEEVLGRPLQPNEVVHHKDGDKKNNSPDNLEVIDRAEHSRLHHSGISPAPETLHKMRKSRVGRPGSGRKFTESQVKEIAQKLQNGIGVKKIAEEYGSTMSSISRIRDGIAYRDFLSDYPDSAFPLSPRAKRPVRADSGSRKFTDDEINQIRLAVMSGQSIRSVAKKYGAAHQTVEKIVEGRTYKHVPWPETIVHMRRAHDMAELAGIFLSEPMSTEKDEFTALKEDYHLIPDLDAVIMLRLVRRALAGDAELAVLLLWLGGFGEEKDKIIQENSVIMQTMTESDKDSIKTEE